MSAYISFEKTLDMVGVGKIIIYVTIIAFKKIIDDKARVKSNNDKKQVEHLLIQNLSRLLYIFIAIVEYSNVLARGIKRTITMEVVEALLNHFKRHVTNDTYQVLSQKINDLRNAPNFDINADSQLPPVSMEMFEGHPDPQAAFREAVLRGDTIVYLVSILEALICTLAK